MPLIYIHPGNKGITSIYSILQTYSEINTQWSWVTPSQEDSRLIFRTNNGAKLAEEGDLIVINDDGTFFRNLFWLKDYKAEQ